MKGCLIRVAVLLTLAVPISHAEIVTWNGDDSGGDQIWMNADNNSWSSLQYDNGDTAEFLGAGAGTVTIDAGGVTPGAVNVNASASYTFSGGSIGGNGGLTKSGSGTCTLTGTNTYTGSTIINAGTLIAVGASALGTGEILPYSATLHFQVDGGVTIANEWGNIGRSKHPVIIIDRETPGAADNWTFTKADYNIANGSSLTWRRGANVTSGIPTLNNSSKIHSSESITDATLKYITDNVNVRINGHSNTRGRTLEFQANTTGNEIYGPISDGWQPCNIKITSGTWTISSVNPCTGITTVNGGVLIGETGGSIANSDVTVNADSSFGCSVDNNAEQFSCKSLTVSTSTGTTLKFVFDVEPSESLAPLKINNNLAFSGVPVIEVDPGNVQQGKDYPLLVVGGVAPSTAPPMEGVKGSTSWGGAGNKTLYLNVAAAGMVLIVR